MKRRLAPVVAIDTLPAHCWCEAEVVRITPAELKAGRTASCGRKGCVER